MKSKVLKAMLGIFVVMTALSGCGQKEQETELASLEISGVEVVTEDASEKVQMETLELDLSLEDGISDETVEVTSGDLVELEDETEIVTEAMDVSETVNTRKPGEAEEDTELAEEETEEVQKDTSKSESIKKDTSEKDNKESDKRGTDEKQTENLPNETELKSELTSVETERVQQMSERQPESEKTVLPECETEEVKEQVTESAIDGVTGIEKNDTSDAEFHAGIMTVNDRVNIRKKATTDAEIVSLFTPGMKLLVTDVEGDWASVLFESENGIKEGYIKTEFLFDAEMIYFAKEKVNVRKEASTESDKIGELLEGDKVILVGETADEWFEVRYSTENGIVESFVKAEFLEKSELNAGVSLLLAELNRFEKSEDAVTEAETEEVLEPQTESETEEVLKPQTEAETEETSEKESEAFAETNKTDSEEEIEIMTVNNRVNVRVDADTQSEALDLLIPGNIYEILEEKDEWVKIHYIADGKDIIGYIKNEFVEKGETVYEASEKVNVRKEPSTDAEKLVQLLAGDLVVVIEESESNASEDDWSNVRFSKGGKIVDAYVKSEFLNQVDLEKMLKEAENTKNNASDEMNDVSDNSSNTVSDKNQAGDNQEMHQDPVEFSDGIAGQYELIQYYFPEVSSVGIIYSESDKNAAAAAADYEEMSDDFGFELITTEIVDALDIDLAASVMVGDVDCVICIDDKVVNDLVQTICAYANEVEIPVIGVSEEQVSMGCLASYNGKTVTWNEKEAERFGIAYE